MNKFKLIQTANRRKAEVDRRIRIERRGRPASGPNSVSAIDNLRELLDEAHTRIRILSQEVDALKKEQ